MLLVRTGDDNCGMVRRQGMADNRVHFLSRHFAQEPRQTLLVVETQCETPVRPGNSSFDPTRYQHQSDTSGAVRTSRTTTVNPLSRTADRNSAQEPVLAGFAMSGIIQINPKH